MNDLRFLKFFKGGVGIIYARHCLFLYQGHHNNVFLLDNLNGQLWFLPAIFISYILFWFIVKADKKIRPIIVTGYIVVNVITSFLPILLPWSLDTVFITADLMYVGFLMKPFSKYIEHFDKKKIFQRRAICSITLITGIYFSGVKLCGNINTSVRIFGSHGVRSILLYMVVGMTGTALYLIGFVIAENTSGLSWICTVFAYIGRHTMIFLVTHMVVFEIVESMLNIFLLNLGYIETIIKVFVATALGIGIEVVVVKLSMKNQWMKLLL